MTSREEVVRWPGIDKLKPLAGRINRLLDERDGIAKTISEIYREAKGTGYVPKVLRKAIARQRMDPAKRAEEDSILNLYESALDDKTRAVIAELKAGSTFDATSEKAGTPRRTVARIAQTVPKNSETGTKPNAQVITPSEAVALPMAEPSLPTAGDGAEDDLAFPPHLRRTRTGPADKDSQAQRGAEGKTGPPQ